MHKFTPRKSSKKNIVHKAIIRRKDIPENATVSLQPQIPEKSTSDSQPQSF